MSEQPAPGVGDEHAWLALEPTAPGRYAFTLPHRLARFDAKLFGGTGLALAVAALEIETGRGALWTTVQFVGGVDVGERIDLHVEVLADGHRTSQVRLTGTVGERVVLTALGSTAVIREGAFGAAIGTMPDVPGPDDSPPMQLNLPPDLPKIFGQGPFVVAEYRDAVGPTDEHHVWARMREQPQTRASLGYLADFVPAAVARSVGRAGGGTSLDNSIRFGSTPAPETDWVLIQYDPYLAQNGYLHGAARMWSPDGVLLAVASQTAVARLFD